MATRAVEHPDGIAVEDDLEMSPETVAMVRALTGGANRERLEFLG